MVMMVIMVMIQWRPLQCSSNVHLWSQDSGAVTGYVLLTALVEVALSVLVHAGLTGAAGAVAALRGRPPPNSSLRAGAGGHAGRRALVLVRRRPQLSEGRIFLYPLDAVGCSHDDDTGETGGVMWYGPSVTGDIPSSAETFIMYATYSLPQSRVNLFNCARPTGKFILRHTAVLNTSLFSVEGDQTCFTVFTTSSYNNHMASYLHYSSARNRRWFYIKLKPY